MAWRPTRYLIDGELDNTQPGKVTGWMRFAGMQDVVKLELSGDFHRDIRGAAIRLTGQARETGATQFMEGFCSRQPGQAGDITAGHRLTCYPKRRMIQALTGLLLLLSFGPTSGPPNKWWRGDETWRERVSLDLP